jgi:hypothetical protein
MDELTVDQKIIKQSKIFDDVDFTEELKFTDMINFNPNLIYQLYDGNFDFSFEDHLKLIDQLNYLDNYYLLTMLVLLKFRFREKMEDKILVEHLLKNQLLNEQLFEELKKLDTKNSLCFVKYNCIEYVKAANPIDVTYPYLLLAFECGKLEMLQYLFDKRVNTPENIWLFLQKTCVYNKNLKVFKWLYFICRPDRNEINYMFRSCEDVKILKFLISEGVKIEALNFSTFLQGDLNLYFKEALLANNLNKAKYIKSLLINIDENNLSNVISYMGTEDIDEKNQITSETVLYMLSLYTPQSHQINWLFWFYVNKNNVEMVKYIYDKYPRIITESNRNIIFNDEGDYNPSNVTYLNQNVTLEMLIYLNSIFVFSPENRFKIIQRAINHGNLEILKYLISTYSFVFTNFDSINLFACAIEKGNLDIVKCITSSGLLNVDILTKLEYRILEVVYNSDDFEFISFIDLILKEYGICFY